MTEIVLTTEKSGQMWNTCSWDLHTGTSIKTYKDDSSSPASLCLLNDEYILSAVNKKPLIYVWSLHHNERVRTKIVTPGPVTAMAVSYDSCYCLAAVGEKIHIWQISTGSLLAVIDYHYQTIRKVLFTDDGSYFISAGDDNQIIVWDMCSVFECTHTGRPIEPFRSWAGHSLPVTDLHCGSGGVAARIVSTALDHTMKIWDLLAEQALCTFISTHALMSVTMDACEMFVFAGCDNGDIHQVSLHDKPHETTKHISDENKFHSHSKAVTCLAVSLDGSRLVSGSDDMNVIVWDIASRQALRTIPHKGAITNILIAMLPQQPNRSVPSPLVPFKKSLDTENTDAVVEILRKTEFKGEIRSVRHHARELASITGKNSSQPENDSPSMETMEQQLAMLKGDCLDYYQRVVQNIVLD